MLKACHISKACKCGNPRRYMQKNCLECHAKAARKYRAADPEKARAYERARYAANPSIKEASAEKWRNKFPEKRKAIGRRCAANRRARQLGNGGTLSKDILKKLRALQKNRCPICRSRLKDAHLDHVIAIANGGRNDDDNVQLLCASCNRFKSDRDPIEFMQSRGFLL